ncbi:MAG: T9SS type A sorting domain-containing protein [Ignavibacteriae bacterium]|nr:T9SS type A sorting domain-containing protein [Ignavibacteriota bacterium]
MADLFFFVFPDYPLQKGISMFIVSRISLSIALPAMATLLFSFSLFTQIPGDEKWSDEFGYIGTNNTVLSVAGTDNALYIGGDFTQAGGNTANCIAKWNGRMFAEVGGGTSGGMLPVYGNPSKVKTILVNGNDLYIGGNFREAGGVTVNGIAKWNGSSWSALGSGTDGMVLALKRSGDWLYVGGTFTIAGGLPANHIARYNIVTNVWDTLGSGMNQAPSGGINTMAIVGENIFVGGLFDSAGHQPAKNVAVWNGSTWSQVGLGLEIGENGWAEVADLEVINGVLYATGNFLFSGGAGGVRVNHFARFVGGEWSPIGTGLSLAGSDMEVTGDNVFLSGVFDTVNGNYIHRIAKWNYVTDQWSGIGGESFDVAPTKLFSTNDNLYAVGGFVLSQSSFHFRIARWNYTDHSWNALGKGLDYNVFAMGFNPAETELYVGGGFGFPGGVRTTAITKYSNGKWDSLWSGVRNQVFAVASTNEDVFVAGTLLSAGGNPVNNIARWNYATQTWNPMGSGLTGGWGTRLGLAVRGNEVFVGGNFTSAGGVAVNSIAKWSPTGGWSALGSGLNGRVNAIAVTDSFVYVGGEFTTAGGAPANYVARWNGTTWSALGSGTDYQVFALAVNGNEVFVGGEFENAGGVSAKNIAKWNSLTQTWSALGSGVNYYGGGFVGTIATKNNTVYAGGFFNIAGSDTVSNIAMWNDSSQTWSALGSGVDNEVRALALNNLGELYVGGLFQIAGGKPAYYFSIWNGMTAHAPNAPLPVNPSNDTTCVSLAPTFLWNSSQGATSYRIQISTDSTFAVVTVDSNNITTTSLTVSGLLPTTKYFWRVNASNTSGSSSWSATLHFTTRSGVLSSPSQLLPENGRTGLPNSIRLYWDQPCNAPTFILQVAYDSLFSNMIFSCGGINRTWYDFTELLNGTWHYWRLRSVNGSDTSSWSGIWKFKTWGGEPYTPTLASPGNDSTCVSLNPVLRWNAAPGASYYRLQVSTDSLFVSIMFDSNNIVQTSKTILGLLATTTYYWRVKGTNDYGTSEWSTTYRFTTREGTLLTPALTNPSNGAMNVPVATTLTWQRPCGVTSFILQVGYDSAFTSVLFNSGVTASTKDLFELPTATWHYWRLRSVSGSDTSAWSSTWKFRTIGGEVTVTVTMNERWNLISVPLTVSDYRRSNLFPSATSSAFAYTGSGYAVAETLRNGKGYWLKFASSGSVNLTGVARSVDTFNVAEGWNLIGSISSPFAVKYLSPIPSVLFTSGVYEYNRGYELTDTIKPGKGYWVHANQTGKLVLSLVASQSSLGKLNIISKHELPPPPPEGDGNIEPQTSNLKPETFMLEQNYPNPFNPSTIIRYQLPVDSWVTLKVYNVLGEEVAKLADGLQVSGFRFIEWDASGLSSGMYMYRMTAGKFQQTRKLILLK